MKRVIDAIQRGDAEELRRYLGIISRLSGTMDLIGRENIFPTYKIRRVIKKKQWIITGMPLGGRLLYTYYEGRFVRFLYDKEDKIDSIACDEFGYRIIHSTILPYKEVVEKFKK